MLYIKCSWRIFTIYAFKNEAVCREVQTHFGSSLPASFTEKVLGAIPRFVSPKMKRFAVKFRDAFRKLSPFKLYIKCSGRIFPIYASKNETVCRGVQTHFGSSCLASFINKVLGAFSQFMRRKPKLFAVKFRRIPEVLCVQVLKKMLWAQFHDLCV